MSQIHSHQFILRWEMSGVSLSCFYYSQGSSLVVRDIGVWCSDAVGEWGHLVQWKGSFSLTSFQYRIDSKKLVVPSPQNGI